MLETASEITRNEQMHTVITTSPPHSTQLAGLKIKKKFPNITWIADLRDPWTDIFYYDKMLHLPWARKKDAHLEKKVLKNADHVITVGVYLKNLFFEKVKMENQDNAKFHALTNGYDPDDFKHQKTVTYTNKKKFLISYVGTMNADYNLNSFIKALKLIDDVILQKTEMQIVGSITENQKSQIENVVDARFIQHVAHHEAIAFMQSSDVLLLLIPHMKHNRGIVTGKIFEYIASGRPVLGIGPVDGDAAVILQKSGAGRMFDYQDYAGIKQHLSEFITGQVRYAPSWEIIGEWSRKEQVEKLIALF
jgi:glycosyltransferase involved in cell wall biosynthesis